MKITITSDAEATRNFLVAVEGELTDRRGLNAALGARLADELQSHFRSRNSKPNRMGGMKTNFWEQVAEATQVEEITENAAVVSIAETRYRIHLYGGTIKPTGGRRFLTIPLIKEARSLRVADYEKQTGRKLFRLPGTGVLVERSDAGGERFLAQNSSGVIRGKTGYRKIAIGGGSKLRAVYALKTSVTIKRDPAALPPAEKLLSALQETANAWAKDLH
ncbi:MAG: hypothetical protein Q8Q59_15795 [Luteolibacter sp.]|nr:hypothetical protein [Luteolibacter sp.]